MWQFSVQKIKYQGYHTSKISRKWYISHKHGLLGATAKVGCQLKLRISKFVWPSCTASLGRQFFFISLNIFCLSVRKTENAVAGTLCI